MALVRIKARKAGIFYSSPGAKKPPFIKVGSKLRFGQNLFIIEMMKALLVVAWDSALVEIGDIIWLSSGKPYVVKKGTTGIVRVIHAVNESEVKQGQSLFDIEVEGEEPVTAAEAIATSASGADENFAAEAPVPEENKLIEVRSGWVGWYFLSPVYATKPYVQLGQVVKKGTPLCRIKTRAFSGLHTLFRSKRLVWKHRVVRAPVKGILRQRCAEDEHEAEMRLELFGDQKLTVVRDGFAVDYDRLLFKIEPID